MPAGRRAAIDRALRRHAVVHREASPGRSLSIDESVAVDAKIGRRELLRRGGLAGAGVVLGARGLLGAGGIRAAAASEEVPAALPRSADGPRVVIVGAGLAGLTAAYRLYQAGLAPRVFEGSDRVGGRCWSARELGPRLVGEHGGEFIDTRHVHLRVLVDELGLRLDDLWQEPEADGAYLAYADGRTTRSVEGFHILGPAIERLARMAAKGPLGAGATPPQLIAFDEMTAADWYAEEVGPTDTRTYKLWAQRLSSWYGLDPDRLGAGNLIDFYVRDYPGGDERYTVRDGNDQVTQGLLAALSEGSITYEATLVAVRALPDDTVELHFDGVAHPVVADRAILAIPFTTLREADLEDAGFSATMLSAVRQLAMGTNAKLLLELDRRIFEGFDGWSGGLERGDPPAFGTWESSSTDPARRRSLLTVYYGGREGAELASREPHRPAPADIVDRALRAIADAVPRIEGAHTGRAWLDAWPAERWVRGSYAAFGPGQMARFWGALAEPQGSIHLAGEQTSEYSQGFLNGGVESGSRAAAEILAAYDLPLPAGIARSDRQARRFASRS